MALDTTQLLPDDAISEVLTWLPAKEVAKSHMVCRSCRANTSNVFFYLTQSRHACSDSGIIVQRYDGSFQLFFLDYFSGVSQDAVDLLAGASRKIVASANGLVFYQNKCDEAMGDLSVYNPARRTTFFLPPPYPSHCPRMGIAISFVDSTDYELLCVRPTDEWTSYLECKLYSSKDSTWKELQEIHIGPRNFQLEYLVFSNGILYLAPNCGPYVREDPYIVFYDVKNGSSGVLSMPLEILLDPDPRIRIVKWSNDSVCLIHCRDVSVLTVWRLDNYKKASWVRIHQVSMESRMLEDEQVQFSWITEPRVLEDEQVQSFTILNDKTLVFATGVWIYAYNMRSGELRKLGVHCQGWYPTLCSYANTLRPCGRFEWTLIKI